MVMLHLELMTRGSRVPVWWTDECPANLLDPTLLLLGAIEDDACISTAGLRWHGIHGPSLPAERL